MTVLISLTIRHEKLTALVKWSKHIHTTYATRVNTADDMATCDISVALPETGVFFPFAPMLDLHCLPWQTTGHRIF
jgi:hypothetical protein